MCSSLHGLLQHTTFIFQEGHSTLPPLSSFISKFHNNFSLHHAPHSIFECALWWKSVLSTLGDSHSLVPHCAIDSDVWVDVSSSWGLGLVMKDFWSAWCLLLGWDCEDREIGWAES